MITKKKQKKNVLIQKYKVYFFFTYKSFGSDHF